MFDPSEVLSRIEEKLDRVAESQARHEAVLAEHQRRSLANEAAVDLLRKETEPLKRHVWMWSGIGKAVAIAGTAASIIGVVVKLLVG